ncbi:MAG: ABC transporter permease [Thermoplasmatota archaeon]
MASEFGNPTEKRTRTYYDTETRGGMLNEIMWVAWRSFKKLFRNPMLLFFSLFMPLIWLIMFSQTFGTTFNRAASFGAAAPPYDYVAVMLPAVAIMTAIQSASQSGFGMVADLDSGFMDKFFVAPMRRSSVLVGKLAADGLRMAVQTTLILVIAYVLTFSFTIPGLGWTIGGWRIPFAAGVPGALMIILMATAFGIAFSGLSNAVALRTKNTETTMMVSFTLTFPLQFLSSALIPASLLPAWVQSFSNYNPVSYVANAARDLIIGSGTNGGGAPWDWTAIGQAFAAILIFGIVLNGLAISAFRAQGK